MFALPSLLKSTGVENPMIFVGSKFLEMATICGVILGNAFAELGWVSLAVAIVLIGRLILV